jgi:uncharacterized membrane protein YccC
MPLAARRVFRLSLSIALSLVLAYVLKLPLPFLAPVFALFLGAAPAPPMGLKGFVGLALLVTITSSMGLLLVPLLLDYPVSALLIVALGLFLSNYLTVNMGKEAVGMFMVVGLTMISAAGMASFEAAIVVVQSLVMGIGVALLCQPIVYPFFPEDDLPAGPPKKVSADAEQSSWIALRATIIVFPAYMMVLINPSAYIPLVMKSVSLGQQGSLVSARSAGRELLGSTFLGGCFAILFWFSLGLHTTLWMYFLLMLLLSIYVASKIYQLIPTRFPASFWLNTFATMLILLGPAVEDSANGKDVYKAFAVRMSLFVLVTLYAWAAVYLLERLRNRHLKRADNPLPDSDTSPC